MPETKAQQNLSTVVIAKGVHFSTMTRVHKNRRLVQEHITPIKARSPVKIYWTVLKIEQPVTCLVITAYVYSTITVRVTIFSTRGKVSKFYGGTCSHSSRLYLCALIMATTPGPSCTDPEQSDLNKVTWTKWPEQSDLNKATTCPKWNKLNAGPMATTTLDGFHCILPLFPENILAVQSRHLENLCIDADSFGVHFTLIIGSKQLPVIYETESTSELP